MSQLLNAPFIISILLALTVHEWAHAFTAYKLGDPTAREHGRLTLNPVAHLDFLGTIMFLIVGFGWGKPVPVDPRYFRSPKKDNALVAFAGPLSNLVLAIVCYFVLAFLMPQASDLPTTSSLLNVVGTGERVQLFFVQVLANLLFVNLGLMAFNLLPIAPLDGSNILHMFIPLRHEIAYENIMQRGPMILLAVLILERVLNVPILTIWISLIMDAVLHVLQLIA